MPDEWVETEIAQSQPADSVLRIAVIDDEEAIGMGCQRIWSRRGTRSADFRCPKPACRPCCRANSTLSCWT